MQVIPLIPVEYNEFLTNQCRTQTHFFLMFLADGNDFSGPLSSELGGLENLVQLVLCKSLSSILSTLQYLSNN